jgi:hypothetical protein
MSKDIGDDKTRWQEWFSFCKNSREFIYNDVHAWLAHKNINYKWFFSIETIWRYYSETPYEYVPYTTIESFGELVSSFISDLPKGVVEVS